MLNRDVEGKIQNVHTLDDTYTSEYGYREIIPNEAPASRSVPKDHFDFSWNLGLRPAHLKQFQIFEKLYSFRCFFVMLYISFSKFLLLAAIVFLLLI